MLKTLPNRNFQVAGHTDNVPIKSKKFRSNWDLSTARAVEVTNFMIGAGMEPKRLSAAGYADQSPVAPNDSPETWPRTGASRSRWSPTWTTCPHRRGAEERRARDAGAGGHRHPPAS